jgi:cytochrome oxidase assembly protein ShyY1
VKNHTTLRTFLRPKWLLTHLLVIFLVVLMMSLSMWQFRRLDERKTFNAGLLANTTQAITPIKNLALNLPADLNDIQWRRVVVRGTFRPSAEVTILNRSQDGTAGVDAATPLDFTIEGKTYAVIVDRGFIPLATPVPKAPNGEVELIGRIRLSQERRIGALSDAATGVLTEAQHLDVKRLSSQTQLNAQQTVLPFYLDLLASPQITASLPAQVTSPKTDNGPHLSYAIQWILFSLCAVAAWVILVKRALRALKPASTDAA